MDVAKLTAQTKDVGGIPVARILPNVKAKSLGKTTIGAWCFLDHAGPASFGQDNLGLQVGSHPHANLQTFTWMLSGEILHKDSLGNTQAVFPKQVNLMTAGTQSASGEKYGICHTEQTSTHSHELHAVQLWIALPMDTPIAPSFYNYPDLPCWQANGVTYTLTTGKFNGYESPAVQYSPLVGVDMVIEQPAISPFPTKTTKKIPLSLQPNFEYGILVLAGEVCFQGQMYVADELLLLTENNQATPSELVIEASHGSHLMLLGGEPLSHPTLIWWNFVDRDTAGLKQSVADWNANHVRFGEINLDGTPLKRLIAPELTSIMKFSQ